MIVATTQFSLSQLSSASDFWGRIESTCDQAKKQQARALLFPEYFALSFQLEKKYQSFRLTLIKNKDALDLFKIRMQQISQSFDLTIIAGSVPDLNEDKFYNRCFFFNLVYFLFIKIKCI